MKTDIITFHFVNNFGGALQAYALQKAVEKNCNTDVEIIDYRNSFIRFTDTVRLLPVTKNPHEILSGIRTLPERFGRVRRFRRFGKEKMYLTERSYNHLRLKKAPPQADVYICGSDQIWNPFLTLRLNGAYFLDFAGREKKRIAYAPSFGNSKLDPASGKKVRQYLEGFDGISVREQTGIDILQELGIQGAVSLIDPTFLLQKADWDELAGDFEHEEPYILLYIMQPDSAIYDHVKKIKDKLGLRIVEISRYGYNPGFIDETQVDVGPEEFVRLFKNAAYICTNSYHGFIFSLIFEKRFCLIPCKRFGIRITNLADMLSIKVDADAEEARDTEYDPELVRERIGRERETALNWLKSRIQTERGDEICETGK